MLLKRREEDHGAFGFGSLPGWYETELGRAFSSATEPLLVDLVEARPGERWLDAGAGTGRLARLLAARGAEVVAAEHDPLLLALAAAPRAHLHDRRGRHRGSALRGCVV